LRKAPCISAKDGHSAPHGQTNTQQVSAIGLVSQAGYGDANKGIKNGERDAAEKSHLGIAELQIVFNRLVENPQYRAVEKIYNVDKKEHTKRIP
jgi:hypothetical protein